MKNVIILFVVTLVFFVPLAAMGDWAWNSTTEKWEECIVVSEKTPVDLEIYRGQLEARKQALLNFQQFTAEEQIQLRRFIMEKGFEPTQLELDRVSDALAELPEP